MLKGSIQDLSEWLKTRVQEIEESISENKIPNGEPTGLCKYCKHQSKCFDVGNGLTNKPLSIPKPKEKLN